MNAYSGSAALPSRQKAPLETDRLAQIVEPLSVDLDRVRELISDRAFREESFGDLLLSTTAGGTDLERSLPPWFLDLKRESVETGQSIPNRMAAHLLARGGKLFRGSLVLSIVRALSTEENRGPKLAAAMELIHLATLVHDDVIDRADIRRGVASLPSLYDNAPTVLMGDHLFARAFELIAECDNLNIISSSCRATSAMCRGEIEQLHWIGRADVPEEAYFRLIEMKTAALMASCAESAALLCGKGDDTAEWYGFGLRLGLVFQMTDDLLDFTADETSLGKRVSSDAADGKYTLPLILYRERIGGADALEDFLRESEDPNDIFEALEREGAFEATRKRIEELAGTCHADLDRLDGKAAGELAFARIHELVDFVVERDR